MPGFTGDPFTRCFTPVVVEKPRDPINPCIPSPCGPNADCRVVGESAACSCLANYIGAPPNCRPECTINPECVHNRACMNQRCVDPCPGSCGSNAKCAVINHTPSCSCDVGYTGDPFQGCAPVQGKCFATYYSNRTGLLNYLTNGFDLFSAVILPTTSSWIIIFKRILSPTKIVSTFL